MIVLFTDFGPGGPYLGQMKAVLAQAAPGVPVIELMSDVPAFDARLGAYLLADISHISGLVIAGAHPCPIDCAHFTIFAELSLLL